MKKFRGFLISGCAVVFLVGCAGGAGDGPKVYHDVMVKDQQNLTEFQSVATDGGIFDEYAYGQTTTYSPVPKEQFEKNVYHNNSASSSRAVAPDNRVIDPTYSDGSIDVYTPWASKEAARTLQNAMQKDPAPLLQPAVAQAGEAALMPVHATTQADVVEQKAKSDKAARIYFRHGQKIPDSKAQKLLSSFSQGIKNKNHPIEVTGYASRRADVVNTEARQIANLKTSLDRAFEVSKHLIGHGVPAETIKTSAWGEARAKDHETESRRVEITSLKGQE